MMKFYHLVYVFVAMAFAQQFGANVTAPNSDIADSNKYYSNSIHETCIIADIAPENCSCERTPELCVLFPYTNKNGSFVPLYTPLRNYDITVAAITTIAVVIGVFGNSAVLAISYRERTSLTKNKELIAQLAVVDFLSCTANFVSTVHLYWTPEWIYGVFACKLMSAILLLTGLLSAGYILIIAVERFVVIICPRRIDLRDTNIIRVCIIVNLTTTFVAVIPTFIMYGVDEYSICSARMPIPRISAIVYNALLLVFFVILPALIVSLSYFRVIHHLRRDARTSVVLNRDDIKKHRQKTNLHVMKVLIFIMAAFTLCVLPTRVIGLHWVCAYGSVSKQLYIVWAFIQNITYPLHSCINPMIYTAIDPKWRAKLFGLFFLRRGSSRSSGGNKTITYYCSKNSLNFEMGQKV